MWQHVKTEQDIRCAGILLANVRIAELVVQDVMHVRIMSVILVVFVSRPKLFMGSGKQGVYIDPVR